MATHPGGFFGSFRSPEPVSGFDRHSQRRCSVVSRDGRGPLIGQSVCTSAYDLGRGGITTAEWNKLEEPSNAYSAMAAGGCARTILISLGKASTPAHVEAPACLAAIAT